MKPEPNKIKSVSSANLIITESEEFVFFISTTYLNSTAYLYTSEFFVPSIHQPLAAPYLWCTSTTMDDLSARTRDLHLGHRPFLSAHEVIKKMRCTAKPYTSRISHCDLDHKLHKTPMAPFTTSSFLSPLPRVAWGTPNNFLERTPDEIILEIISCLDIASLVQFARCNSGLRSLIVGLRHVRIVKSNTYIWSVLLEMLNAGTARFFTLENFVSMLTTSKCAICKDSDAFAPWVCLMLCERVCGRCIKIERKNIRLPQNIASKCLGLSLSDMIGEPGTASVFRKPKNPLPRRFSRVGSRAWRSVHSANKLDIIPLRLAVKLSLEKHAEAGGASHVKKLIQAYIRENDPKLLLWGQLSAITDGCDVRGLADLIVNLKEWKRHERGYQDSIPNWILTGYMPFLHSAVLPLQLEPGLLCEGCERVAFHTRQDQGYIAAAAPAEKAYLSAQYEAHFQHCDAAQSIYKGERLRMSDEEILKEALFKTLSGFDMLEKSIRDQFLNRILQIDFDRTPLEVTTAVQRLLFIMNDIGKRCLQQRVSSRQVVSSNARRLENQAGKGSGENELKTT